MVQFFFAVWNALMRGFSLDPVYRAYACTLGVPFFRLVFHQYLCMRLQCTVLCAWEKVSCYLVIHRLIGLGFSAGCRLLNMASKLTRPQALKMCERTWLHTCGSLVWQALQDPCLPSGQRFPICVSYVRVYTRCLALPYNVGGLWMAGGARGGRAFATTVATTAHGALSRDAHWSVPVRRQQRELYRRHRQRMQQAACRCI